MAALALAVATLRPDSAPGRVPRLLSARCPSADSAFHSPHMTPTITNANGRPTIRVAYCSA